MSRFVLHVDLDQFIAAVEVLRHPELRGRPVVVGGDGDPTKRGVVSTASYEAREFGVRSGMPLRTALKRCREAIFLPVDAEAYLAASREVMTVLRSFPAVVQVAGWDEAFMAVDAEDPEAMAREVQQRVLEQTSLWCSIGIGDNKLRAKLATGFSKPAGVFRLTRENWTEVMDHRPTDALWGIGAKTARKLAAIGILTVSELAASSEESLAEAFGPRTGPWLRGLAIGDAASDVTDEPYVARGHGRERTFQRDIRDPDEVRAELTRLARELVGEMGGEGRAVERVVVKLRFSPFFTTTRSVTLDEPTRDPEEIERRALVALARVELDRPVRLVGIRVEFTEAR